MADVFISYKREDRPWAERVDAALKARGLSTWWDTSLVAGEHFNEAIDRELNAARCVVVIWSEAARASRWVNAEAVHGFDRDVLVAGRIDDVKLGYPFSVVQTVDVRVPGGLGRLVAGAEEKLGHTAKPAPQLPPTPAAAPSPFRTPSPPPERDEPEALAPKPGPTLEQAKQQTRHAVWSALLPGFFAYDFLNFNSVAPVVIGITSLLTVVLAMRACASGATAMRGHYRFAATCVAWLTAAIPSGLWCLAVALAGSNVTSDMPWILGGVFTLMFGGAAFIAARTGRWVGGRQKQ